MVQFINFIAQSMQGSEQDIHGFTTAEPELELRSVDAETNAFHIAPWSLLEEDFPGTCLGSLTAEDSVCLSEVLL